MPILPSPPGSHNVGCVDVETEKVLLRVYYPTENEGTTSWLPKTWFYAHGYANFLNKSFLAFIFYIIMSFCKMHVSSETNLSKKQPKYPVILYTHGLGGMRTTYSAYCSHMASHGFIVAAIESRDGSAAVSMRNNYSEKIVYKRPEHLDDDFIYKFRREQLENVRVKEVFDTINLLQDLNKSTSIKNKLGSSFDLNQFADSMDFSLFVIAGHSFGGATAITVLQEEEHPFTLGLVQDPWMMPTVKKNINVPIFSLQSEHFHWKKNLQDMHEQFKNNLNSKSIFGVVRGTAHQSFSDFVLFWPTLMKRSGFGGNACSIETMKVMVETSMEFIVNNASFDGYKGQKDYFQQPHELAIFQEDAFKLLADQLDMKLD